MPTFPRRKTPPAKKRKHYSVYRPEVREDFKGCCAYCGVHEGDWPHNQKNYQLDHFRPKGKPEFEHLENDFYNLRWCCHICNRTDAKGNSWPSSEEEAQGRGFVNLCEDEWQSHYNVLPDGKLEPLTTKAIYTIEVIGLNGEGYVKQRLEILQKGGTLFQDV